MFQSKQNIHISYILSGFRPFSVAKVNDWTQSNSFRLLSIQICTNKSVFQPVRLIDRNANKIQWPIILLRLISGQIFKSTDIRSNSVSRSIFHLHHMAHETLDSAHICANLCTFIFWYCQELQTVFNISYIEQTNAAAKQNRSQ